MTEDVSFAMEDEKVRSWICNQINRENVEALGLFKDFPAIKEADEKIGAETEVPHFPNVNFVLPEVRTGCLPHQRVGARLPSESFLQDLHE